MPKFNITQIINLKKSLEALGLKNLFENADLSGIADSVSLKFNKGHQKAFIAVSEVGIEVDGAIDLAVSYNSTRNIIDFTVDQEFLVFVVQKTTGCLLFFAHIKNPLKSN